MRISKKIFFSFLILVLAGGFFVCHFSQAQTSNEMGDSRTATQATDSNAQMNTTAPKAGEKVANVAGETITTKQPSDWNLRIPVLFHIIGGFLYMVLMLLNKLIALGANLIEYLLGITNFTNVSVVQIGWGISRGLCNMGFALVLLLMAFATVLRIESFGMKRMLIKLILAALLINFSLVFAGILIDFAQVLTNYFISAAAGSSTVSQNLMNGLQITRVYDFGNTDQSFWDWVKNVAFGPTLQMIAEQFMGIVLFVGAAFSFYAMAFFLIARIVAIWILLAVSPLAWLGLVTPNLGKMGNLWSKWWDHFFKWVFFAPIYSFFLYLALVVAQNGIGIGTTASMSATNASRPFASSFFTTPSIILQYIVIIYILLYGLKFAQEAGITGANTIRGWGKDMWSSGKGMGSRWLARGGQVPGAKKLGEWLDKVPLIKHTMPALRKAGEVKRGVAPMLSPDVWNKFWAARKARAENFSFSQASGNLQDLFTMKGMRSILKGQPPPSFFGQIEKNRLMAQQMSELNAAMPDEDKRAKSFLEAGNTFEKEVRMRSLASTNSLNTLFGVLFRQSLQPVITELQRLNRQKEEIRKNTDLAPDQKEREIAEVERKQNDVMAKNKQQIQESQDKFTLTPQNFRRVMTEHFGQDEGARIGNEVQQIMTANGNFVVTGSFGFDETKGKAVATSDSDQLGKAKTKFSELEPQDLNRRIHPDSFWDRYFELNPDGNAGFKIKGLSEAGKAFILENWTSAHSSQLNRMQFRNLETFVKNAHFIEQLNDPKATTFLQEVRKRYDEKLTARGGTTEASPE